MYKDHDSIVKIKIISFRIVTDNVFLNFVSSFIYRSAKFFNFFARLFTLFYHSPMYETFPIESKIKHTSEKFRIKFRRSVNVA